MKIDVYSTNTCAPCFALKNWLNSMHIPYTNHDVQANKMAARYLVQHYGQAVPVIEINGKGIVGFNRSQILKVIMETIENE